MVDRVFPSRVGGFSLIEVMIVVVIIGILSTIAYPSYTEYIHKGRRGDATAALLKIQQAQERWRSNNLRYGALSDLALYGVSASSEKGFYGLTVSVPEGSAGTTAYTATATRKDGTAQSGDAKCKVLSVTFAGGVISYAATDNGGGSTRDLCWSK